MGWFWGSSSGTSPAKDDPYSKLDPALRSFLDAESPVKYKSSTPPSSPDPSSAPARPYTDQLGSSTTSSTPESTKSLYPDGRYAHLWQKYKPLAEIETQSKTQQDKLLDVLEGYKHRKAEIGRAALENCALEQCALSDCYRSGSWKSRLTMCHAENQQLERCYMMQGVRTIMHCQSIEVLLTGLVQQKFLKALGYLSTFDRPPEVDEKIQMHADTLYHRMLDQERAIEKAKTEGLPPPTFEPLLPLSKSDMRTPASSPDEQDLVLERLSPDLRAQVQKRLNGLSPKEKELEQLAIVAEIKAGEGLARQLDEQHKELDRARLLRREKGQETAEDKISTWFGW